MSPSDPSRGEIWVLDLDPIRGHEQAGRRPCLVLSVNPFNHGPAGLAIALPLTTRARGIPLHIVLDPPEGGVRRQSFIMCEAVRSVSKDRFVQRWGAVTSATMSLVEDRLRILLGL